jgi:hypothetical protein
LPKTLPENRLSQAARQVPNVRPLSPAVARLVSVYFYHLERSLSGKRETKLDRAVGRVVAKASPQVRESYGRALSRYKAMPFQRKVELGFDPQLLARLQDVHRPLSQAEMAGIRRQMYRPVRTTLLGLHPQPVPPGGYDDAQQTPPGNWYMKLAWSKLICHDESNAAVWGEAGEDEPVAIFLMLESQLNLKLCLTDLSEPCREELSDAFFAGEISQLLDSDVLSDASREELLEVLLREPEMDVTNHWLRRTRQFEDVEDGSTRSGHILLMPQRQTLGWRRLRELVVALPEDQHGDVDYLAMLQGEKEINIAVPVDVAVATIFEIDGFGPSYIMDEMESYAEGLEEVADDLLDGNLPDVPDEGDGARLGFLIGSFAGRVGGVLGAAIGAIVGFAMPDLLGHGEMVFTPVGYGVGIDAGNLDLGALTRMAEGTRTVRLRHGLFTGCGSDYELQFGLTWEQTQATLGRIRGHVRWELETPVSGGWVTAGGISTTASSSGYSISLFPGTYTVVASHPDQFIPDPGSPAYDVWLNSTRKVVHVSSGETVTANFTLIPDPQPNTGNPADPDQPDQHPK